jgi:hypothetical protein
MTASHPSRAWVLIALAAVVAGAVAVKQYRRLGELQTEIARMRGPARVEKPPAQKVLPSRPEHEPRRSAGFSSDGLSLAGAETLPEARELIARLGWLNQRNLEDRAPADLDDIDRLEELLAGMGAATVRTLIDDLVRSVGEEQLVENLRGLFHQLAPREALAWSMIEDPGPAREHAVADDFNRWTLADPAAALKWFQEMEAKGDPLASAGRIAEAAFRVRMLEDPAWAVANIERMKLRWPGLLVVEGGGMAGLSAGPEPRQGIALVDALNAAADKPDASALIRQLRDLSMREMAGGMAIGLFRDAVAVADASFTPEQKWLVAEAVGLNSNLGAQELPQWGQWIATLDGEPDKNILPPLIRVLRQCASSPEKYGEPVWLDALPPGPKREEAVACYIQCVAGNEPEVAARWLTRLPDGEKRQNLMDRLSGDLPPDALKDFLKQVGASQEGH